MSWGRSDDRFPQNRKIVALSDAAFRLYVTARDYANAEQTDGFLAMPVVSGLTRAPRGAALRRVLAELTTIQAGEQHPLWETVAGGYQIHDFLVYNLSRAENAALRAARNEKKVAGGKARAAQAQRAGGRFTSNAPAAHQQPTSSEPAADQLGTSPVPDPIPEPLTATAETQRPLPASDAVSSSGSAESTREAACDGAKCCLGLATAPARLDDDTLNATLRKFPRTPPDKLDYVARWYRQRKSQPDPFELGRVMDELLPLHGHSEVAQHFARLTDPTMPSSQFGFHTLRTFRTNFAAYGPTFTPQGVAHAGTHTARTRSSEDAGKWDREAARDARVVATGGG